MQALVDAIIAVSKFLAAVIGSAALALIEALALLLTALVEALLTAMEGMRQFGMAPAGIAPYQPGTSLQQAWDSFDPLWQGLARWIFQD